MDMSWLFFSVLFVLLVFAIVPAMRDAIYTLRAIVRDRRKSK